MPANITRVRWSVSDLPWGLSFDEGTGTFNGTAEDAGEYTVPVTVETNYGKDTKNVVLRVKTGAPRLKIGGDEIEFVNLQPGYGDGIETHIDFVNVGENSLFEFYDNHASYTYLNQFGIQGGDEYLYSNDNRTKKNYEITLSRTIHDEYVTLVFSLMRVRYLSTIPGASIGRLIVTNLTTNKSKEFKLKWRR